MSSSATTFAISRNFIDLHFSTKEYQLYDVSNDPHKRWVEIERDGTMSFSVTFPANNATWNVIQNRANEYFRLVDRSDPEDGHTWSTRKYLTPNEAPDAELELNRDYLDDEINACLNVPYVEGMGVAIDTFISWEEPSTAECCKLFRRMLDLGEQSHERTRLANKF